MPRFIKTHETNRANKHLVIRVEDEPGAGGACHDYAIAGPNPAFSVSLQFHNGPLDETGIPNGITHEALLAILIDRLQGFSTGPFTSRENALALTKLQEAFMWLQARTN